MPDLLTYLMYVGLALALWIAGTAAYIWITPHREFALIRAGNKAAALSLGGFLVGLALVLASVLAHSIDLGDLAVWSAVGVAFQVAAFWVATLVVKDLKAGIEEDRVSLGLFLAAVSIAVGLINAGAMTY